MKRAIFLSFIAFSLIYNLSYSQKLSETDKPGELPALKYIGFYIGFGGNIQNGEFYTNCNCLFDNGKKLGYSFGTLYEQEINSFFSLGSFLGYDNRSIKATYQEYEELKITSTSTGRNEIIPILFRNTAFADFSYIYILPYLKFNPFKFAFIRLGFDLNFNISSNIRHEKELMQTTARLSNGEIVKVNFSDTKEMVKILEDAQFRNTNPLVFGISSMIGANIKLSKKAFLTPIFIYSFPLNNFSKSPDNFNVLSLRGILELRILINSDKNE